jgi:hypothetical protein
MKSTVFIRSAILLSVIVQAIVGCGIQPTNIALPSDVIALTTDKPSYAESDTVRLFLKNSSTSDVTVGMRCGIYLEMFYQKKDNLNWGDTLWFPYMSLRCLTRSDTVGMNTTFTHSIPAAIFSSTGTFRLTLDVAVPTTGVTHSVVSNLFAVQ